MTEKASAMEACQSNGTSSAAEALLRACGAEARSDFRRLTHAACEADRASPELAAAIRECAIVLMGCAVRLNRVSARADALSDELAEADLDRIIAALPTPPADAPAAELLSYHAIHALTAARQTKDDLAIQIAEALACLAGFALAQRMALQ